MDHCLHIFREAGASVTDAGIEKLVSDARVGSDTLADHLDIGSEHLGQVGHFVHEADFSR
ncbi:hypothetical protein D3C85_1790130 [compost metagenome]